MISLASISMLKDELQHKSASELVEISIRLIKFKKENKELLHYILFESNDEQSYILHLKSDMDDLFKEVNTSNLYWAKKTVRKILRWVMKHAKYSGLAITQIELLIHFCEQFNTIPINFNESVSMMNLYNTQIQKIEKQILTLHEDLQFDCQSRIEGLKNAC